MWNHSHKKTLQRNSGFQMNEWRLDTDKEGFLALWKIVTLNELLKKMHPLFLLFFCLLLFLFAFFLPHEITRVKAFCFYAGFTPGKGQLISKCAFRVFKPPQKNQQFFLKISALASKKRSNQKSSVRESKNNPLIKVWIL